MLTVYRNWPAAHKIVPTGSLHLADLFLGTWLLLVTGGEPTVDKPDMVFAPPPEPPRSATR